LKHPTKIMSCSFPEFRSELKQLHAQHMYRIYHETFLLFQLTKWPELWNGSMSRAATVSLIGQ